MSTEPSFSVDPVQMDSVDDPAALPDEKTEAPIREILTFDRLFAEPRLPESPPPKPVAPIEHASRPVEKAAAEFELSRFSGIIVRMRFSNDTRACFEVACAHHRARVGIDPLRVLEGQVPPMALALVIEWVMLHQNELLESWERARRGEALETIAPLG